VLGAKVNNLIGIGEKWEGMSDSQQIAEMKKEKDNAKVGFFGGIEATNAGIKAKGGVDKAIALDVTDASQKASQQKGAVEGLQKEAQNIGDKIGKSAAQVLEDTAKALAMGKMGKDFNSIDSAGGKPSFVKGQEQQGITAGAAMKKSMELASDKDAKQNIIDNEIKEAQRLEHADPQNNKGLVNRVKGGMEELGLAHKDENGNMVATDDANAWVRGRAGASANNSTMEDTLNLGGMTFDEKLNAHGEGTVAGKTGHTASSDNTTKASIGSKLEANRYNPDTMEGQKALDFMEHATNPIKAAQKLLANAGAGAADLNQMLIDNGYDTDLTNKEASEYAMDAANATGIGLGALAVNQTPKIFGSKRSLADITDDLISGRKNPETSKNSESETNSDNNKKSFDEPHSNSLNSDTNSITKNGETRKFVSDAKLSKVADIGKGLGEGIIFGEVMSDAPKMSINEGNYNLARVQAAPNNVFSGIVNAGLATLTSSASMIDAVVPGSPMNNLSKKYLGTNLSTTTAQLLHQSGESFGNAWKNVTNIGSNSQNVAGYPSVPKPTQGSIYDTQGNNINPVAPAPQQAFTPLTTKGPMAQIPSYAQNAFRTPPMGNTIGAMGGTTAYNNSMNQLNTGGPASNKTDTQFENLDKLSDIDMSNESIVEAMEGLKTYYEEGE